MLVKCSNGVVQDKADAFEVQAVRWDCTAARMVECDDADKRHVAVDSGPRIMSRVLNYSGVMVTTDVYGIAMVYA